MSKPDPEVGQIIRFDYLWFHEAERGRVEGTKDRPCAVIVSRRLDKDGRHQVLLAPITHSEPTATGNAIEVPARFAATTGLDGNQSWLVISEVNRVDWSDPGIVPASSGQWLVGRLPVSIARKAVDVALGLIRGGKLRMTRRNH